MKSQSPQSLPKPGTPEYEDLPQYVETPPLPFRRTIRRQELHQIVPLAETTIYLISNERQPSSRGEPVEL